MLENCQGEGGTQDYEQWKRLDRSMGSVTKATAANDDTNEESKTTCGNARPPAPNSPARATTQVVEATSLKTVQRTLFECGEESGDGADEASPCSFESQIPASAPESPLASPGFRTTANPPSPRVAFTFGAEQKYFSGNPHEDISIDQTAELKRLQPERAGMERNPDRIRKGSSQMPSSRFKSWKSGTILNYFHVGPFNATQLSGVSVIPNFKSFAGLLL